MIVHVSLAPRVSPLLSLYKWNMAGQHANMDFFKGPQPTEPQPEPEPEPSQSAGTAVEDTAKETGPQIVAPEHMQVSLCKIDDVRRPPLVHGACPISVSASTLSRHVICRYMTKSSTNASFSLMIPREALSKKTGGCQATNMVSG